MRVPGFGPEARAWQARVLTGYTTPAQVVYNSDVKKVSMGNSGYLILKLQSLVTLGVDIFNNIMN